MRAARRAPDPGDLDLAPATTRPVRPQGFPDGPHGTAISAGSSVRNIGAVDRARLFNREQAVADELAAGTADSAVGDPAGCDRLRSLLGNG